MVCEQKISKTLGVLDLVGEGLTQLTFALAQVRQFDLDTGNLLAERFLSDGGGVGAQGHLSIDERLARVGQALGQIITLEPEATEIQPLLIELEAIPFEFGQVRISERATADDATGDAASPVRLALLVQFPDAIQVGDASTHIGSQGLKVAHCLKLIA